jgi:protein-S-isoprenylcysteine O-methyltransferase Ste14
LLVISLYLVTAGVLVFKISGKTSNRREDPSLYKFEKTTHLITSGIFKYIRHPMYSSLLFLTWGIYFKDKEIMLFGISLISSLLLYITARMEELENIHYFGPVSTAYMKKSKMFIPYVL